MKHRLFFTVIALATCSFPVAAGASTYDSALAARMHGRILLQVEEHGEAWYVRSKDSKRYYMKDGAAAYSIMRFFSQAAYPENQGSDDTKIDRICRWCYILSINMDLRKSASSFAVSALILASLIGVCTQMLMSCGVNCSEQPMSAMQMNAGMAGCGQNSTTCSASMKDHMTTFASMYPSVGIGGAPLLPVVGVAFLFAWFLISKRELCNDEKLRARFRSLRQRLSHSIAPLFLTFAFSRGILNSKIYS